MTMNNESVWKIKGHTLSDKSAKEEYGLTEDEIITAIKSGKLQYRINYIYENPYYKLIRAEVEKLVAENYGENYLKISKLKNELKQVDKELERLKTQTKALEKRKEEKQSIIKEQNNKADWHKLNMNTGLKTCR